jgi:hypothetical protein
MELRKYKILSGSGGNKLTVIMRLWLAIWLVLVIAVSITPLSFKLRLHTIGPFHDFGHYIVYGLTGIFLWLVAKRWQGRVAGFVFGIALSLGQEWAENKLYNAGYEWKDVNTDIAGLVSGFALVFLITALLADPGVNGTRPGF